MGLLDPPVYSRTQSDARFLVHSRPRGVIPGPVIASRSLMGMDFQTDAGMFTRVRTTVLYSATDLRIVYGNHIIGTGDQFPTNSIKVKASVETPAGTYFPVWFPGSDDDGYVSIQPGCFAVSSPLPIEVSAGDLLYVNTNVAPNAAGGSYPVASTCSLGGTPWEYRIPNTTTDYTTALPPDGDNTTGVFYTPHCVTGLPTGLPYGARPPQVFIWGDSIMHGSGDSSNNNTGIPPFDPTWGTYDLGWVRRGLNNTVPYVFAARSGTGVANFDTNNKRRATAALMTGCTHAIEGFGANDIAPIGVTAYQTKRLELWKLMASRGLKVYATTVTPRTDSTDSWATTTNQTVKSWESDRTTFNDWLRDVSSASAVSMHPASG